MRYVRALAATVNFIHPYIGICYTLPRRCTAVYARSRRKIYILYGL